MVAPTNEHQLRQLREGDRLNYHGVQWQVIDHSTYTDAKGYETEEWLLKSQSGKEYYLMRELDPQNPESSVNWYVAEEVRNPSIYEPSSAKEITYSLGDEMRSHKIPYPKLRMFNRTYQFESQTEGEYDADGRSRTRITWDYWDSPHLWNLALEAWNNGELSVYSTRKVQPADFTNIKQGSLGLLGTSLAAPEIQTETDFATNLSDYSNYSRPRNARAQNIVIAWIVTIVGFFLMLAGI